MLHAVYTFFKTWGIFFLSRTNCCKLHTGLNFNLFAFDKFELRAMTIRFKLVENYANCIAHNKDQ